MYSKPLVSVILPTYNRAHLIKKSIQSVLQQTFKDFELLVVDDGSADDTESVVHNLSDPRIKYIKCIENKGVSSARNIGIKNAQGEYIALQDSDTEWYPNKLEMHMEAFKTVSPDVGVVYTGLYRFSKNGKKVYYPTNHTLPGGDIHSELLLKAGIWTVAVVIKKECFNIVDVFDETMPCVEDWELFIRLSKEFKFRYIDKPSYISHYTEGSLLTNQSACLKSLERILEKHKDDFNKNKKALSFHSYRIAIMHSDNNDFNKARKYLLKSILADPYNIKYYKSYIESLFGKNFIKQFLKIVRGFKKRFIYE